MRHTKVIKLDDERSLTVKELRVKDVRKLMARAVELGDVDINALIGPRFSEIAGLAEDFIDFPEGENIDNLTGSEIEEVINGIAEVNKIFLKLAGMEMTPETMGQAINTGSSTGFASPSLKEGT